MQNFKINGLQINFLLSYRPYQFVSVGLKLLYFFTVFFCHINKNDYISCIKPILGQYPTPKKNILMGIGLSGLLKQYGVALRVFRHAGTKTENLSLTNI